MSTDIQLFGDMDRVKEIGARLRQMMVGAQKLTEQEALAVAQLAVAHGLDPFNGEVWGLKSKNGEWRGTMIGVKGLRRGAQRQLDKIGPEHTFWTDYERVTNVNLYSQDPKDLVILCHLKDTVTLNAWTDFVARLIKVGMRYDDAVSTIGKPPVTIGIGIVKPWEKPKMGRIQLGEKRAESAAIKKRFNVDFIGATHIEGETGNGNLLDDSGTPLGLIESNIVEGEVEEEKPKQTSDEIIEGLGFSPSPETSANGERPYSPETVREKIEQAAHKFRDYKATAPQRSLLRYALELCFAGEDRMDDKRHTVLSFLTSDPSTTSVDSPFVKAILDKWLKPEKDDGGDYQVNADAEKEAHAIYAQALKDEGQMEMEV